MTTNKFMKLITMAFGMAISACSFAATGVDGDIFDIRPCDAEGNAIEAYASSVKRMRICMTTTTSRCVGLMQCG